MGENNHVPKLTNDVISFIRTEVFIHYIEFMNFKENINFKFFSVTYNNFDLFILTMYHNLLQHVRSEFDS